MADHDTLNQRCPHLWQVVHVDVDAGHGNWSNNARLLPRYSVDASGDCPTSLFLKMVNIDLDDDEHFGNSEVAYYTRDVPEAPLVRCHHAAYSKARDGYHLLLDDIGATHIEATGRPPTLEYALALADGLAALHARWWGADQLAAAARPIHDAAHIQHFVDIAAPGVPHVLDHLRDRLTTGRPDSSGSSPASGRHDRSHPQLGRVHKSSTEILAAPTSSSLAKVPDPST